VATAGSQTARSYRRVDAVEKTVVGDRTVLYHKTDGTALVLNPTGSLLWEQLERPLEAADLVRALAERFAGLDTGRAESDVASFLSELTAHHLLQTE
jgi:hypothetical protein